jgi:hypothetical protein
MKPDDPWLSIEGVAKRLDICSDHAARLVGHLPHCNWSGDKRSRRWRTSVIDAWLESHSVGGPPAERPRSAEPVKKPRKRRREPDISMMWGVR